MTAPRRRACRALDFDARILDRSSRGAIAQTDDEPF